MDVVPVDFVCKTTLMAATAAKRGQFPISIFQSGSSGHDPVTIGQVFNPLLHYWPQARAHITENGALSKIHPKIRISYYGPDDFETGFPKKNAKKLQMVKDKIAGYENIEKRLAFAYKTGKMFDAQMMQEWFFDDRNTWELDDRAPDALRIGLRGKMDWDAYLPIWHMGLHEFVLGEEVDRAAMFAYYGFSPRPIHHSWGQQDIEETKDIEKYASARL